MEFGQVELKKESVKWKTGLKKLSLIQQKQKLGKQEEFTRKRKERLTCVQ